MSSDDELGGHCDVFDLLEDDQEVRIVSGNLAAKWAADDEDEHSTASSCPDILPTAIHSDEAHSSSEASGLAARVELLLVSVDPTKQGPDAPTHEERKRCLEELLELSSSHAEVAGIIRGLGGTAVMLSGIKAAEASQDDTLLELLAQLMANCGGVQCRGSQVLIESFEGLPLRVQTPSYIEGGLGWQVWPAARMLGEWMIRNQKEAQVEGQTVLELAAGLGVPGILAAKLGAQEACFCLFVFVSIFSCFPPSNYDALAVVSLFLASFLPSF